MGWLKKWWKSEPDPADDNHGPLKEVEPGDWVVMPYRIAEAARISMSTIVSHPELPDSLREWITGWLHSYNAHLANYFQENYGTDIFPVLDQITHKVWKQSERHYTEQHEEWLHESFHRWEEQLGDGPEQ